MYVLLRDIICSFISLQGRYLPTPKKLKKYTKASNICTSPKYMHPIMARIPNWCMMPKWWSYCTCTNYKHHIINWNVYSIQVAFTNIPPMSITTIHCDLAFVTHGKIMRKWINLVVKSKILGCKVLDNCQPKQPIWYIYAYSHHESQFSPSKVVNVL